MPRPKRTDPPTTTIDTREASIPWLARQIDDPAWRPADTAEEDVWQAYLCWLAGEHFGGRGGVHTTRMDHWASDGSDSTWEIAIAKPHPGGTGNFATVTEIWAVRTEAELTRAAAAIAAWRTAERPV
ncbi:MAG: hypothetical protein LBJ44_08500 [Propionibacteriaceae bacterium]|jgi:hypothetical protein|nr:hypothetical protein [Propionibacteriaceae bacterium]